MQLDSLAARTSPTRCCATSPHWVADCTKCDGPWTMDLPPLTKHDQARTAPRKGKKRASRGQEARGVYDENLAFLLSLPPRQTTYDNHSHATPPRIHKHDPGPSPSLTLPHPPTSSSPRAQLPRPHLRRAAGTLRQCAEQVAQRLRPRADARENSRPPTVLDGRQRTPAPTWSLVGPGAAYERWKKTPAYQQWLKDSVQATRSLANTPVPRRESVLCAPASLLPAIVSALC
jgi:hypothetical protein